MKPTNVSGSPWEPCLYQHPILQVYRNRWRNRREVQPPPPSSAPLGTLYVVFRTSFFKFSENSLNIPFPPPDPSPLPLHSFPYPNLLLPPSLPDYNLLQEINNILQYSVFLWSQPSPVMCYSLFKTSLPFIILFLHPSHCRIFYTIFPFFSMF